MSLRRSATAVLIVTAIIVVGGLAFLTNRLFSGLTDAVEADQFTLMESILVNALEGAESKALARAEMVAALPVTRTLMAAQDRAGLLAEFGQMFAVQKEKYGVDQAQFHTPPAMSLLRLHSPDRFGDDLTKFRPMVVAANRDKAVKKGFAIARTGPAVFGVAPVTAPDGTHLGTFEIGLEFGPMLDALKASFGVEVSFYVEEKPLREFAQGLDPALLSDQNRVGRFIRYHSTNAQLMNGLARDGDIAVVNETTHYTRDDQGVAYGVLLLPLKNAAGDALGVIAVARDFSGSRAAAGRSLVWQVALSLIAIVLLAGAAIIVVRGMVLRPLGVLAQRIESDSALVEDSDRFPPEVARLAARIETLKRGDEA